MMPLRVPSVVDKRKRNLISIVKRSKTHQSLFPFDTETKFLDYLIRPLIPLTPEVLEVTDYEKIWNER